MASTEIQASPAEPSAARQTLGQRIKRRLFILSFCGLGVLYVLTLANDQVHGAGYRVIEGLLASTVSTASVAQVLGHSSTAARQRDAAVATDKLMREKEILVASSKVLQARQVALVKSIEQAEAANGALKRTAQIKAGVVMKTTKRLALRTVTNAARNVSSVFAEAIPVVGTGIMLGVTAWDVIDACETIKDINELNGVFEHPQEDSSKVCGIKVPTQQEVLSSVQGNAKAIYQSASDALKTGGGHLLP